MTAKHPMALSPSQRKSAGPVRGSGGNLGEQKEKLTIGVAAALGIMVFYNWREKRLARSDPEGYARLQRLRAVFRANEPDAIREKKTSGMLSHPMHYKNSHLKRPGAEMPR